jgi:uncharacterized protein (DUF2249 family)
MSERPDPAVVVDARGMLPPEPLERTLEGLDQLGPGERLLLIIPRRPAPLFDMLDQNGYRYQVSTADDGMFHVLIEQIA